MLEDDVIQEVNEAIPWVSKLVIVPKKSGELKLSWKNRIKDHWITRSRFKDHRIKDQGSRIKDQLKMN